MEYLPDFVQFKPCPATPLKDIFIAASDDLLDVLQRMLTMDPLRRINATEVDSLIAALFTLLCDLHTFRRLSIPNWPKTMFKEFKAFHYFNW